MTAEIKPIGGVHRSASSLLAEIMNDPAGLAKVVVMTIDSNGDSSIAHFEMTRGDMCYAAAVIQRYAFGAYDSS